MESHKGARKAIRIDANRSDPFVPGQIAKHGAHRFCGKSLSPRSSPDTHSDLDPALLRVIVICADRADQFLLIYDPPAVKMRIIIAFYIGFDGFRRHRRRLIRIPAGIRKHLRIAAENLKQHGRVLPQMPPQEKSVRFQFRCSAHLVTQTSRSAACGQLSSAPAGRNRRTQKQIVYRIGPSFSRIPNALRRLSSSGRAAWARSCPRSR